MITFIFKWMTLTAVRRICKKELIGLDKMLKYFINIHFQISESLKKCKALTILANNELSG